MEPEGIEIPRKLMPEIGAINNRIAAIMMINKNIKSSVGNELSREKWSFEQYSEGLNKLPEVLEGLVRQIKKVQNAKG